MKRLDTPNFYKNLVIEDKNAFKSRIFDTIEKNNMTRKHMKWSKKKISVIIPIIILPLAGFTFAYHRLIWSGENFVNGRYPSGPISTAASPNYQNQEFSTPGIKTYDLSNSRRLAKFPIREPIKITNWTKILSEGIVAPIHNYNVNKNHQLVPQKTTYAPLAYVDIYTNAKGQRVSVTQEYDPIQTVELRSSKGNISTTSFGNVYDLGNNAQLINGYGQDNLVYLITGNWAKDFPWDKAHKGNFENILIFHVERNNTITKIIIDEYGNVSPSVMESIAHSYLNS